jgi:LmbE family N-acetylglucosaminyl deacetylase
MWFWASEDINHRYNITDTFDFKLAALRCHESQLREYNIPQLEDWLRQRCKEMADGADFELTESFHRVEISW